VFDGGVFRAKGCRGSTHESGIWERDAQEGDVLGDDD